MSLASLASEPQQRAEVQSTEKDLAVLFGESFAASHPHALTNAPDTMVSEQLNKRPARYVGRCVGEHQQELRKRLGSQVMQSTRHSVHLARLGVRGRISKAELYDSFERVGLKMRERKKTSAFTQPDAPRNGSAESSGYAMPSLVLLCIHL